MGKKIAAFLGVLASIAGILSLLLALNILHANSPPSTSTPMVYSDTCIQGYVWREAVPNDHVCVTPATRAQAQTDNSLAPTRTNPDGTCIQGYVWREAIPNDHVCVTPATRAQTQNDNSLASNRVVHP